LLLVEVLTTLAYACEHELLFVLHNNELPDKTEWKNMVAYWVKLPTVRGVIVKAPGTAPDANMRNDIRDLHVRFNTKIAVVTTSVVTRGVLTALGWFNVPIRPFLPTDLKRALTFVERDDMLERSEEIFNTDLWGSAT
jgi:hypothetical protein